MYQRSNGPGHPRLAIVVATIFSLTVSSYFMPTPVLAQQANNSPPVVRPEKKDTSSSSYSLLAITENPDGTIDSALVAGRLDSTGTQRFRTPDGIGIVQRTPDGGFVIRNGDESRGQLTREDVLKMVQFVAKQQAADSAADSAAVKQKASIERGQNTKKSGGLRMPIGMKPGERVSTPGGRHRNDLRRL